MLPRVLNIWSVCDVKDSWWNIVWYVILSQDLELAKQRVTECVQCWCYRCSWELRQLTPSYTSSCRILLHLPPPLLTYYRYRNNISPTQLVNSLSNVRNLGWAQKSFLQWLASQTAWEVKTTDLVTFNFIFEF